MAAINAEYRWRPIADLEEPAELLEKPELRQLAEIWEEQRHNLEDHHGLIAFQERLRREWSIETGLLERIYTLDRGVTEVLIERGLHASLIPHDAVGQDPERIIAILRDHEQAIDFLFDVVKGTRRLSESFIKELHALLTRNQETSAAVDSLGRRVDVTLVRGAYKALPNNPSRPDGTVHEYCPPEHVASEMQRLLELHEAHSTLTAEVQAAWLHHRFTQIHPFQDGNGRVARSLATLVFIKAGWFPLVVRDVVEERTRYLDALEAADFGELKPLVAAFGSAQRKAFVQALGISSQVLRHGRIEQVIAATRDQLVAREAARRVEWDRAKVTARELQQRARSRFQEVRNRLISQTGALLETSQSFVDVGGDADGRGHFFRNQVIDTARRLGYFANLAEFREWVRLVLETGNRAEILVSFHGSGHEFRGVLAASACFFRREQTEQGEREIASVTPLSSDIFQINYREPADQAATRFDEWLEDAMVKGLEVWRKGL